MWTERIVEAAPAFDHDAGLRERVEDLAIEKFITNAGVEALDLLTSTIAHLCLAREVSCWVCGIEESRRVGAVWLLVRECCSGSELIRPDLL